MFHIQILPSNIIVTKDPLARQNANQDTIKPTASSANNHQVAHHFICISDPRQASQKTFTATVSSWREAVGFQIPSAHQFYDLIEYF